MAKIIKISDVVEFSKFEYRKTVKIMLEHMQKVKSRDTYSAYAPHLGFGDLTTPYSASNRKLVGAASFEIWRYCTKDPGELLPWLNMLIVTKDNDMPGEGMIKWYESTFNTLKGYEKFCKLHAEMAELMLQEGLLVIV